MSIEVKKTSENSATSPELEKVEKNATKVIKDKKITRKPSSFDVLSTGLIKKGLSKTQAREYIDIILDDIAQTLKKGETISLPGICKISIVHAKARTGRNPSTKKIQTFPAHNKLKFSPSSVLRANI